MKIVTRTTQDNIGLINIGKGVITGKDLINLGNKLFSLDFFPNTKYILDDYSEVTCFNLSNDDIKNIIKNDFLGSMKTPGLIVSMVVSERNKSALLRMLESYEVIGIDWTVAVFNNIKEARSFIQKNLNISEDLYFPTKIS